MPNRPFANTARRSHGFTLVELMITLVVVAILSAVAYPSFMDSIRKSRRSEAFTALNAVQQSQERWRANKEAYSSSLAAPPGGLGVASPTPSGYYSLALSDVTATGYSITATGVAGTSQAQDGDCVNLRVRVAAGNVSYGSAGGGAFTEGAGNRCWSR
jgi:type IV pilus assembly protein PilE